MQVHLVSLVSRIYIAERVIQCAPSTLVNNFNPTRALSAMYKRVELLICAELPG